LGNYEEAIKNFKKALVLISGHQQEIKDPYVLERWKQFNQDMMKEYNMLVQMHKCLQDFKMNSSIEAGFYEPIQVKGSKNEPTK